MANTAHAETPTDSPVAKRKVPKRGLRKRVLGKGEGDYVIYQITPPNDKHIPAGALIPLPNTPQFETTYAADRWLKNQGGALAGKQLMIFKAIDIINVEVEERPAIRINRKPKVTINDPSEESVE